MWYGKEGKWHRNKLLANGKDNFGYAFSFKEEVVGTNPVSFVEIEYAKVWKNFIFTKIFVPLKTCLDGFRKGCRSFLGVDSTMHKGRWRAQLACIAY